MKPIHRDRPYPQVPDPESVASAFRAVLRIDDTPTPVARIVDLTEQMAEIAFYFRQGSPPINDPDRDRRVWRIGYVAAAACGRPSLTCDDSSRLIARIGRAVIWPASTFPALWADDVVDVVTKAECSPEIILQRARDLSIAFVEPDELEHAAALETIAAWQAAGDPPRRQRSTPRRVIAKLNGLGAEYEARAQEVTNTLLRHVSDVHAATPRAATIALAADLERQRAIAGGDWRHVRGPGGA